MKKFVLFLFGGLFIMNTSFGQPGTWTWISGSSASSAPGVYGIQGVPSVNNCPYSGYEHSEWKDKQGNFWIYGGSYPYRDDLWKFNPLTLEWTWVKGDSLQGAQALYGTKGVPGHFNTPGSVAWGAPTWVDTSGALWLLGGSPWAMDLWRYDIGTNDWTWVSGSHVTQAGNHGTLGAPSDSSFPGNRQECASAWVDSVNNLWFFGGLGYDDSSKYGFLNDVWKYNMSTNQWTWMKGSAYVDAPVVYGTKGVSNATNDPGGRWTYARWKDKQGNFWIFGGLGYTAQEGLNDMWRYNPAIDEWTWMGGTTVGGDSGVYGALCQYDSSYWPAARFENRATVTDNQGRFWLCGGATVDSGHCNDLWLFDPGLNQWKLLKGGGQIYGNFGTRGLSSPFIIPPAATGANAWWGNDNKFYMFAPRTYNCLSVYDPDTDCISASVIPLAGFQSDKTSICTYDCTNFKNLSTNSTSWQWIFPGGSPASSSDQNPQVCYLISGVYNVTLIATNSSGNTDSLTINNYITVNVAPPVPVITQVHNDTLFCSTDSSYKSYQWYSDTALIPNATDTFLVISKSGDYNVQVTGTDGCKIAVGININVIIGLQNYMSDHVILFSPNPVEKELKIKNEELRIGEMAIYNTLGQLCQRSEIANGKSEIEVDVSVLSAGIYFVRLIGEKETWTGKFIKE